MKTEQNIRHVSAITHVSSAQLDAILTQDQLVSLAQSREDFVAGRILTVDEAEARTNNFLSSL